MANFDRPIPGQSLTDTPGNHPWEHPPRFTNLNKALEDVWNKLSEPERTAELLVNLDAGIPASVMTKAILFTGFTKGEWTPDLAILMQKPVQAMVAALGERAGIDVKYDFPKEDRIGKRLRELEGASRKSTGPKPDASFGMPMNKQDRVASGGFMGAMKDE